MSATPAVTTCAGCEQPTAKTYVAFDCLVCPDCFEHVVAHRYETEPAYRRNLLGALEGDVLRATSYIDRAAAFLFLVGCREFVGDPLTINTDQ